MVPELDQAPLKERVEDVEVIVPLLIQDGLLTLRVAPLSARSDPLFVNGAGLMLRLTPGTSALIVPKFNRLDRLLWVMCPPPRTVTLAPSVRAEAPPTPKVKKLFKPLVRIISPVPPIVCVPGGTMSEEDPPEV